MAASSSNLATTRQRVAFIVGNDEYVHLDKLSQSVKDAELIQMTLQNIGFKTYLYRNLTTGALQHRFLDFFHKVEDNSLIFFYFNGYGLEHSKNNSKDNYLLGVDEDEHNSVVMKIPGFALRKSMSRVSGDFVVIFVLDTNRTYVEERTYVGEYEGYYSSLRRNSGTFDSIMTQEVGQPNTNRLLQLDLSPQDTNIFNYQFDIVYACQAGCPAIQPESEHGPLARALHRSLSKVGGWRDAIQEATAEVVKETYGRQRPSAEINIMHKLEIKDLAETSQSANILTTEIPDILRKKFQNGMLENENFEFVEEEDDILVNLKNSPIEVTIKGLKLIQKFSQGCRYLVVRLRPQQKINFFDCEFLGIGLRIETSSELNPSSDVVLKNFNLKSEFGFDFENIESACMEKILVKNCVKSGFRLQNIHLVTMKDIHVQDCSVGIDGNDISIINLEDFSVEKCIFGFGLQNCDGKFTNCEFNECDREIYKVWCRIKQSSSAK